VQALEGGEELARVVGIEAGPVVADEEGTSGGAAGPAAGSEKPPKTAPKICDVG
jgi:hypothetical protein